jgi:hypothetical protein
VQGDPVVTAHAATDEMAGDLGGALLQLSVGHALADVSGVDGQGVGPALGLTQKQLM